MLPNTDLERKSRAPYYREYRKRKKGEAGFDPRQSASILLFPLEQQELLAPPLTSSMPKQKPEQGHSSIEPLQQHPVAQHATSATKSPQQHPVAQHATSALVQRELEPEAPMVARSNTLTVAQPQHLLEQARETLQPAPSEHQTVLRYAGVLGAGVICIALTVALIHAAVPAYPGPAWMAYGTAALVEGSLLALVCLRPATLVARCARLLLIVALALYSILPLVVVPTVAARTLDQTKDAITRTATSLETEIADRTARRVELETARKLTLARGESARVNELQTQLRATLQQQQAAVGAPATATPAWLLALQRVLFLIVNLFLAHHLIQKLQRIVG